jgi:hypothetical protein
VPQPPFPTAPATSVEGPGTVTQADLERARAFVAVLLTVGSFGLALGLKRSRRRG